MFRFTGRKSRVVMLGACAALLTLSATAPRVLAQETPGFQAAAKNDQPPFGFGITEGKKGSSLVNLFAKEKNNGIEVTAKSAGRITGLQEGERILGIDIRPANGAIYVLGSSSRLYVLQPGEKKTIQAVAVGGQFAIQLRGTFFGFDFNPTVDRIRVVSDDDLNLRINPNDGTVVDSDGDATNGTQGDGELTYGSSIDIDPNVVGAAYTNSDNDANTGTTLYYIDSLQSTLVTSADPNSGELTTVGSLGPVVDTSASLSFDIVTQNGTNTALATFRTAQDPKKISLAQIDLTTGAATFVSRIKSDEQITSIALFPVQN